MATAQDSSTDQSASGSLAKLSKERLKQFEEFFIKELGDSHRLPLQQIYDSAEKETELKFTKEEIDSAIKTMEDESRMFVYKDINKGEDKYKDFVYKI